MKKFTTYIIFLIFFVQTASITAQRGYEIIPEEGNFWYEKCCSSGSITATIKPILQEGVYSILVSFSQKYYHSDVTQGGMFTMPSYNYYFSDDYIKVVCTRKNGTKRTYSHSFDEIEESSLVPLALNKYHTIVINSETGFSPKAGDIYSIYINGERVISYKELEKNSPDIIKNAAEKNTALADMYRRQNSALLLGITNSINSQSGSYNNQSSSNSSSGSGSSSTCSFCHGTGVSPIKKSVTSYGNSSSVYCAECGSYSSPHYHESCPSCGGRGYR